MGPNIARACTPIFLCQFPSELVLPQNQCLQFRRGPVPHPNKAPLLLLSHFLFGYSKAEQEGLEQSQRQATAGGGYAAEQSTQPQTLGYSLADSPVGLLAWIYEKLVRWTDNYPWDDDEGNFWTRFSCWTCINYFLVFSVDLDLYFLVLSCGSRGVYTHIL